MVFQLQKEALERIKAVKEKGGLQQEIRATIDYVILSRYGEKNPLMLYFARLKMKGWLGL
ncbi:MAG: hypothetical protein A2144_09725 [Chloroflexi bacterium RBG_16_50_9]|nr:MAG: hypothetical protein A2144_09725 [Chloroflexi bacterium RBG_16_50_9]